MEPVLLASALLARRGRNSILDPVLDHVVLMHFTALVLFAREFGPATVPRTCSPGGKRRQQVFARPAATHVTADRAMKLKTVLCEHCGLCLAFRHYGLLRLGDVARH